MEKLKLHSARVRMTCTIELDAGGNYGADWQLGDMLNQARDEGVNMLQKWAKGHDLKIIGEPVMTAAMFPEKGRA